MSSPVPIALDTPLVRSAELLSGKIDGQLVLLSIERGQYYQLNEVASRIWELIEAPVAPRELIERIVEEFAVERATCEQQVTTFLTELATQGLIQVDD